MVWHFGLGNYLVMHTVPAGSSRYLDLIPNCCPCSQSRSGRDDVADSICVFESRQTNGGADSIWREDSLRRRKRCQRDQAAHEIDAGKPAASVC